MTESKPLDVIYLQWYDDEGKHPDDLEGVTWCKDRINETDIMYVRAITQPIVLTNANVMLRDAPRTGPITISLERSIRDNARVWAKLAEE